MSATPYSPIYPATEATTLLGRAWNLFKTQPKNSIKLIAIPTLLMAVQGLLMSVPAATNALVKGPVLTAVVSLSAVILALIAGLVASVLSGFSFCALARLYASALVQAEPFSLKNCIDHVKKHWAPISGVMLLNLGGYALFALMDLIIFLVGVFAATMLGQLYKYDSLIVKLGATVTLILGGSAFFVMLLTLISIQILLLSMPLVTIANPELCLDRQKSKNNQPKRLTFGTILGYSYRLVFANFPKALRYGAFMFAFLIVLGTVMRLPMDIWMGFEYMRSFQDSHGAPGMLPAHVTAIVQTWYSLIAACLMPFSMSAVTIFWYDCKVTKEGLDLRLWLARLTEKVMVKRQDTNGQESAI